MNDRTNIEEHSGSKYLRRIYSATRRHETDKYEPRSLFVDVYAVLKAYNDPPAPIAHAIKKLLCAGLRGKATLGQDIEESIDALNRALQQIREGTAEGAEEGACSVAEAKPSDAVEILSEYLERHAPMRSAEGGIVTPEGVMAAQGERFRKLIDLLSKTGLLDELLKKIIPQSTDAGFASKGGLPPGVTRSRRYP